MCWGSAGAHFLLCCRDRAIWTEHYLGVYKPDIFTFKAKCTFMLVFVMSHMLSDLLAVDCVWNEWSGWQQCNATCGDGRKMRSRTQTPELHGGKPCEGRDTDWTSCFPTHCPGIQTNQSEANRSKLELITSFSM